MESHGFTLLCNLWLYIVLHIFANASIVMPAVATIFSLKGMKYTALVDFGPAARNSAYWSPDGKGTICLFECSN